MKFLLLSVATALVLAACSSMPSMREGERLALYQAHAGAPVSSFRYFGQLNSWEALGDDAIAVWARPHEAWLLELSGPCSGLEFTSVIGLTDQMGQVHAGFDKVLVRDPGGINIPCWIRTIRPLDVTAIKQAEQAARAQTPRSY
ncbi:MAG: DUF6491 family protein [Luteimonas sp.]